jgi:hypothetical protein
MAKWDENYIWQAYRLAGVTKNDQELASELNIEMRTLYRWKKDYPAFGNAVKEGRKRRGPAPSVALREYVAEQLPSDLRELWEAMAPTDPTAPSSIDSLAIQAALATKGETAKQELFIYGLTATNYDVNRVCKLLNISKNQLDQWATTDTKFTELWKTVEWHKKNYFEKKLVELVACGSEKAVIMANQTLNADRGYGTKVQVSGQVNHVHGVIDLGTLELDLETRSKILKAIRESGQVIDVDGLVIDTVTEETRPDLPLLT